MQRQPGDDASPMLVSLAHFSLRCDAASQAGVRNARFGRLVKRGSCIYVDTAVDAGLARAAVNFTHLEPARA